MNNVSVGDEGRVFTVSEVNDRIKGLFELDPQMLSICVSGELSNYKVYPSGHHYFTLKDSGASLKCVMFKSSAMRLRFKPENGMQALVMGGISVYPRDGVYQLYASGIMPDGQGLLRMKFEAMKARLESEGLFDECHKKPIPVIPGRIAVVTSPAGAAVRDIIRILRSRWPIAEVVIVPVRVQGEEAPGEIAEAIEFVNNEKLADIIITGRGGGSAEDLWAFNEEIVARAIYRSKLPVISAVGHEPDVCISDYVADLRASTPSNAAERAVPDSSELLKRIMLLKARMNKAIEHDLSNRRQNINVLARSASPANSLKYVNEKRMSVDSLYNAMEKAIAKHINDCKRTIAHASGMIEALSPNKVIGRGYTITTSAATGRVLTSVTEITAGDSVYVRFSDGTMKFTSEG